MIWASKVVILSNINWLYDSFPNWNLIKNVSEINEEIFSMVWVNKSSFWKWWMESKLKTAKLVMDLWISMYLANWKEIWILEKIWNNENPWTLFKNILVKKVDSIRKWLKAWAVPKWKIIVSTIISDLLKTGKRASLLEIGVEKIEKDFLKWDVVEVCDELWFSIWY
jgi:glutamate 5-kinase